MLLKLFSRQSCLLTLALVLVSGLKQKWFDLTVGLPVALAALRKHLPKGWLGVLVRFAWLDLTTNPFASLGRERLSEGERFTRQQLRPVLILDRALGADERLDASARLELLESIVSETGARFIESNFSPPTPQEWSQLGPPERDGLVRRIMAQFLNAETALVADPDALAAFDVTRCHFAELTRRLDRPELAPLFCCADSVYFGRPEVPVRLSRLKTIAGGDDRCTFRFHF